jgi:hypothetical protein
MVRRTGCSGDNSIQVGAAKAAVVLGNVTTGQIVVPQARHKGRHGSGPIN